MALGRNKRVRRESSSSSSLYLNPSYKETHEKYYSEKAVISERFIDYESFPTYPISQCFSGKNMIANLLHIRGPAPVTPVRLFYSQIHLFSEEDQFFQTFIEGKTHRITPDVIATLLGLKRPSDPVPYPPTSEDELIVSKDKFRRAVYLREHRNANAHYKRSDIKVTHLKPIIKVLVKICQSNIIPRFNRHSETNLDSVYLSFLLLHGYPVDLSYVIWHTMSHVGRTRSRSLGVPYGIIVGRLLSYLGHPFPVDTPCADVPTPLDAETLFRTRIPRDPHSFRAGPGSEPWSPSISPSPGDDDRSVLPLPNDPPTESSVSFDQAHLSGSIQSIHHTMGIILYYFEQQREEFKRQREMVDRIARQQDRLAHQQDCLARRQAQYHAKMMQYVKHAYTDQVIPDDAEDVVSP
ncbi:hypothetical protein BVC80_7745g5 [Macleaya cordata]|uniref:Putative plant transposon protein domain-containing protein n=1 Tax=Macleaya cordata TaxID=56857 RepID=A0A200QNL6_MACCD|nr:hypothetical protein BVC80_7745g5 [Macleaya cordata]